MTKVELRTDTSPVDPDRPVYVVDFTPRGLFLFPSTWDGDYGDGVKTNVDCDEDPCERHGTCHCACPCMPDEETNCRRCLEDFGA